MAPPPRVEMHVAGLLISLWFAVSPAHAQWQPDGIPLTTAFGGQDSPHIAPDGAGGAIAVWRDFRNVHLGSDYDLFAQRVTAEGMIATGWPTEGFPVCTDSAYQDEPQIISDGVGGAYFAWIDRRDGMTTGVDHIYLQRITATGAIAHGWTTNGIPVCPTPGDQDLPKLALDGVGGVFAVWEDYRRGRPADYNGQVDIYAERILADGTVAAGWPTDGLPVCTSPGSRGLPNALADGAGGVFIEWADSRNLVSSLADIYVQRLTAEGVVAAGWTPNGTAVCTAPGYQNLAALAPADQGGLIVVWQDLRSAPPSQQFDYYTDSYAQRLTADGAIAAGWITDGVPVCTAPDIQWDLGVASDGAGGAIIMWSDYRNYDASAADLYAQRILASGAPGWPVDGVALSQAPYWQVSPAVVADGSGGALVAYATADHVNNIDAQHVTQAGTLAPGWVADFPVCDLAGVRGNPAAVSDGSGGMIVAWEEERDTPGFHIYAQRVASDQPTPTLVSLVSTQVEADLVVLTWYSRQRVSPFVYRRTEGSDWTPLAAPRDAGDGVLVFEDRSVSEGRYAYRLGYSSGAGEVFTPEEWVAVPSGYVLALAGFYPNPATGNPIISLSLASSQRAQLEVFDGSGRALRSEDVSSLGPGRRVFSLGREIAWAPGVYWLRLTQGGRSLVAKGLVLR